jgi:SAM-dependent methyltransferase
MNKFLQTRAEVDQCTAWLKSKGLISHHFTCKDFDIANICQELKAGDLLDMGSSGSWILQNAVKMGIKGKKCGIDLSPHESPIAEVEYTIGDLMATPYKNKSFDTITCLSVIEHEVDFDKLAKECSRLLRKGGNLYISFDYWNPKVDTTDVGTKLYGLKWNILDASDVSKLEVSLGNEGLRMTSNMNWTTGDAVINNQFCAPYGKAYTFGLMKFVKA